MAERESMQYDVVIVGAGPAGLAAAIRLKQLSAERGAEVSVCVIEKGSEVGAHILSGAVMDPRAISELFPDWQEKDAPLNTPVSEDRFLFLTERGSFKVPNWMLPACFRNHGNYVISLANVCRWLGQQAESLGVEIFPGFAAAEVLYQDNGAVRGVAIGDMGVNRRGEKTGAYQPGIELHAKYTFFAEGCRGHLGKQLESKFRLRDGADPQVYGIGLKELWEIRPEKHQPGLVIHSAGWPLDRETYGGSFLYHLENNQVAAGFVVGLGYSNPYLNPYEEFQRYKTHPAIRGFFEGGKRIAYGARAITAGGLQSLPRTTFPGGCLIGDNAGFLNASRIKGSHCAIKSGMLAAEAAFDALASGRSGDELTAYPDAFRKSWLFEELHRARNFKPWMSKGLYSGTLMVGIDQIVFGGKAPWTLHHGHADHETLKKKDGGAADPVPEARRRAHFRSPVLGFHLQHQSQRGSAGASAAEGRIRSGEGQSRPLRRARAALLPGRRVRDRERSVRPAAADQRAELRALQDLRHQGSDAEHQLGGAGGRRRTELSEYVRTRMKAEG